MDKEYFEPNLLFRYSKARLTKISTSGKTSTITFLIKDEVLDKTEEHWCFFDEAKHNELLREAIMSDIPVNLLVGRYLHEEHDEHEGHTARIEDRLLEAWKTC